MSKRNAELGTAWGAFWRILLLGAVAVIMGTGTAITVTALAGGYWFNLGLGALVTAAVVAGGVHKDIKRSRDVHVQSGYRLVGPKAVELARRDIPFSPGRWMALAGHEMRQTGRHNWSCPLFALPHHLERQVDYAFEVRCCGDWHLDFDYAEYLANPKGVQLPSRALSREAMAWSVAKGCHWIPRYDLAEGREECVAPLEVILFLALADSERNVRLEAAKQLDVRIPLEASKWGARKRGSFLKEVGDKFSSQVALHEVAPRMGLTAEDMTEWMCSDDPELRAYAERLTISALADG